MAAICPEYAGKATKIIEKYGYDQINLNVDDRVSGKREFGAILMKKGASTIVRAMKEHSTTTPISVKCRIGVDEHDSMEFIVDFVTSLKPYYKKFVIHARTCLLGGLNPAQNQIVPPLNYPRVYALCNMFPDCEFWLNGGIPGLKAAKLICYGSDEVVSGSHQVPCSLCNASNGSCVAPPKYVPPNLKGCMLGRAAIENPAQFWDVDRYFYGSTNPCQNRRQVLEQYCQYLEQTYPRRCCDDDERITTKIPAPTPVVRYHEYCNVCREMYGGDEEEKKECNRGR